MELKVPNKPVLVSFPKALAIFYDKNDHKQKVRIYDHLDPYRMIAQLNAEKGTQVKLISPSTSYHAFNTPEIRSRFLREFTASASADYPTYLFDGAVLLDGIIGYEKNSSTPLSKEIVYTCEKASDPKPYRMIFPVPPDFQGEKGIALMASDLSIENFKIQQNPGGTDCVLEVPHYKVVPQSGFPEKQYSVYKSMRPETSLPAGKELQWAKDKGYEISRLDNSPYVGHFSFDYQYGTFDCRTVFSFMGITIVAEMPPSDIEKLLRISDDDFGLLGIFQKGEGQDLSLLHKLDKFMENFRRKN